MKSPGDLIREELKARCWTQEDLAMIIGKFVNAINLIIQGKRGITVESADLLGKAFGNGADYWLKAEADYRLSLLESSANIDVERKAKLFGLVPVKEIQKRGWIPKTTDNESLEKSVLGFLGINSIDDEPVMNASMRKTAPAAELTPSQRAWCFRVRQLAKNLLVHQFDECRLDECEQKLRKLAAYPQETSKVPTVLGSYGIRFVIVEPLSSGKIDGMADWLDEQSPVIGMSLRFDRIDCFWHTLFHELSHIRHKDGLSIDCDATTTDAPSIEVKSPIERRADAEAAASLIKPDELQSFVLRVGPLYSKERIIQFAHKVKIHPGIIVGQLQHRGEIGYSANREMLAKVRSTVIQTAVTDGWGNVITTM